MTNSDRLARGFPVNVAGGDIVVPWRSSRRGVESLFHSVSWRKGGVASAPGVVVTGQVLDGLPAEVLFDFSEHGPSRLTAVIVYPMGNSSWSKSALVMARLRELFGEPHSVEPGDFPGQPDDVWTLPSLTIRHHFWERVAGPAEHAVETVDFTLS